MGRRRNPAAGADDLLGGSSANLLRKIERRSPGRRIGRRALEVYAQQELEEILHLLEIGDLSLVGPQLGLVLVDQAAGDLEMLGRFVAVPHLIEPDAEPDLCVQPCIAVAERLGESEGVGEGAQGLGVPAEPGVDASKAGEDSGLPQLVSRPTVELEGEPIGGRGGRVVAATQRQRAESGVGAARQQGIGGPPAALESSIESVPSRQRAALGTQGEAEIGENHRLELGGLADATKRERLQKAGFGRSRLGLGQVGVADPHEDPCRQEGIRGFGRQARRTLGAEEIIGYRERLGGEPFLGMLQRCEGRGEIELRVVFESAQARLESRHGFLVETRLEE